MTTTTCDICGERIHGGRPGGRLTLPAGAEHPHAGEALLEEIDCCCICLAAVPGLSTDKTTLEDMRREARRRKGEAETRTA